jgi:hypothetical protein
MNGFKKKPIKLLSVPRKAWRVFFAKSNSHGKESKQQKKMKKKKK